MSTTADSVPEEPGGNTHAKGLRRILLYSRDTFGLGNIRRMLAVATQLVADGDDRHVLLITGSPMVQGVDMPGRIEWLKLPGLRRDVNGECRVRSLPLERSRVLALRAELIRCAAEACCPDLVMVDKSPSGVEGEFMPTLEALTARPPPRTMHGHPPPSGCRMVTTDERRCATPFHRSLSVRFVAPPAVPPTGRWR